MCRVDVIMATYNGEKFLKEQLDSVFGNIGCEVYLHVFDDGSSDETLTILEEYKKKYMGKVLVHCNEQNLGVTKNFLYGIRKVMEYNHEAQYFMLCDQDDVWHQDKIQKTLKRMNQMEKRFGEERPLLVFTDATVVNEALETVHTSFYKSQHLNVSKTELSNLLMENKCIGCTVMINRAYEPYLLEIPQNAKYHDWWLALIASAFGNISYVNRQTLMYRQHANNVVGGSDFLAYVKNRFNGRKHQKESLRLNQQQAMEFLSFFEDGLTLHKRLIVEEFITLFESSFFNRRIKAMTGGYLKSGLVRNIGLMIYL